MITGYILNIFLELKMIESERDRGQKVGKALHEFNIGWKMFEICFRYPSEVVK